MLRRLFNLEDVDFGSAGGWTLRFTSEWSLPVVLLGVLGLLLLVWQVYRREKGTASPRYKLMLGLLRIWALAVLVFVLLQPALIVRKSELKQSYVILLADRSDSMKLEDKYRDPALAARLAYAVGLTETPDAEGPLDPKVLARLQAMSRAEIANRVLAQPRYSLAAEIARNARVRQFVFAGSLSPAPTRPPVAGAGEPGPLLIEPDGATTQIGEALRDAVAELRGQRIAAVVVLSDWNSNSGLSPREATRFAFDSRSPFPIHTVGVGDPTEQRDILVAGVTANSVAFLNDPLPFNVAIEQFGFTGATVPLELRIDDKVVARRDITLEAERKHYTISYRPDKEGVFKVVVSVPGQPDELSLSNNRVEHTLTVKDDKVRVLMVAGMPTWEWRYLKTALVRDKTVEVSVWLQSAAPQWVMAGGKQLNQLPLNQKELVDNYDVILMLGASAEAMSDEQLENLRAFVSDFGGGLIFAAGSQVITEAFDKTPLAKALPVTLTPPSGFTASGAATQAFVPQFTSEGWTHPALRLVEDDHQNRDLWQNLPGLFWLHPTGKPKPGARVLASHPVEKSEDGLLPLFVEQRYGAGRVFYIATDETWRWRYLVGDRYFYRFWRQAAGLMASNKLLGASKRLTLAVAKTRYTVGQKVEFEAKALDEMLRPSGEPQLSITLDLPGGGTQSLGLALADPSLGIYRGSFIARRVGDHLAWAKAPGATEPERAPFSVSMSTLESESRSLDIETMKAVARKTGGEAFMIDEIDQIPERIQAESANILTEHPTDIWDSWGFLLLFAIPLTLEWWLRKRRQLT
jgi:hypothetical protein